MFEKILKKFFNYTVLCSSGFLIMFIPKCSFSPFYKDKSQEDAVQVFRRVIVDESDSFDEELKKIEEDDDLTLLDE
jgi:hypothetical protein